VAFAFATSSISMPPCARCIAYWLRERGFVILEFMTPSNPVMRSIYHLYFHRILPAIGEW